MAFAGETVAIDSASSDGTPEMATAKQPQGRK
jgi:hypothetical protein